MVTASKGKDIGTGSIFARDLDVAPHGKSFSVLVPSSDSVAKGRELMSN